MGLRLTLVLSSILAAAGALAGVPAYAFTVENRDASAYTVPEFNLDEQLRHFRNDGTDAAKSGKYEFDGLFGKGTVEIGTRQGPTSNFGTGIAPTFGSFGVGPSRRDFNRVTAPPSSADFDR